MESSRSGDSWNMGNSLFRHGAAPSNNNGKRISSLFRHGATPKTNIGNDCFSDPSGEDGVDEFECPICLGTDASIVEGRSPNDKQSKVSYARTLCGHIFHEKCIGDWFDSKPVGHICSCPCCRKTITKKELALSVAKFSAKHRKEKLGDGSRETLKILPMPQQPEPLNIQPQEPQPTHPLIGQLRPVLAVTIRAGLVPTPSMAFQPVGSQPYNARDNNQSLIQNQPTRPMRMTAEFQPLPPPVRILLRERTAPVQRLRSQTRAPQQQRSNTSNLRVQPRRAARVNHPHNLRK